MMLYLTSGGPLVERQGHYWLLEGQSFDALLNDDDLSGRLDRACDATPSLKDSQARELLERLEAPLGTQEVWAAGVTYYRSRTARMEESEVAGGASFYDKVYQAPRPELFFKATPHRVAAPGGAMHLRRDSKWIVPEPELTLVVNRRAQIIGYTIGNDLSCRDIEGENPLYLPQAKVSDRCAAVGPGILVSSESPAKTTRITLGITRDGASIFAGQTTLEQLKRDPPELVRYLFDDNVFPAGCLLMTGTGIVPPDNFCLQAGDVVTITIDGIGTLTNFME